MNELRLTIELVPEKAWQKSLKDILPAREWNKIRTTVIAESQSKCGICSGTGRMNCHEVWEYDDKSNVQRLNGFVCLCNKCHFIKHFGMTQILAAKGSIDIGEIINHFLAVNSCDLEVFETHKKEAFAVWRRCSQQEWKTDYGPYADLVRACLNQ